VSSSVTVSVTIYGIALLFCLVVAMSTGEVPLWVVVATAAFGGLAGGFGIFIGSGLIQKTQAVTEEIITDGQGRRDVHRIVYTLVAIGSLLIGLQGVLNPVHAYDRDLGTSCLLTALILGFLALREYRASQHNATYLTLDRKASASPQRARLGKPRTTLLLIAIFAILLVISDVRRIRTPSDPNDVWIGIGQMAIWLPGLGYLAYREYCRMGIAG